jgi:lipopolysaccharide/colanic/teichoic acid biosynthesis glycosyltransferase
MTRAFDLLIGLAALIALAPVLFAVAVVVLVNDGRPLFFHQKRVGRNGRLFEIWKFRTMRTANQGCAITAAGDERVTGAGVWLRKLKLDELPQLFNVVKGDMSLIGPRPEVPEFVELNDAVWQAVLAVRPGITDLASLLYRDEEQILKPETDPAEFYRAAVLPAKLRLNLQYLETRSWRRDMKLLWLTARYSFFPRGFDPHRVARSFGV